MRIPKWQMPLIMGLAALTIALYAVRYFAFPDPMLHNEMWRFLVGDVAFLFLQILLVTMVIDELIQRNRRDELRQKLNMVIGAFFAQSGRDLIGLLACADRNLVSVRDDLVPRPSWTAADYARARGAFAAHVPDMDLTVEFLTGLDERLAADRAYFLGLISNQALLEHGSFTDLLWAVTHLSEELSARPSLSDLPNADTAHLAVDVKRAFVALGSEWLGYLEHLQANYPHLFSLAVRMNPLDPTARVTIAG